VRDQRELSNEIAEHFAIQHESPQLITFKDGKIKDIKNHHSISSEYI
jgi:bacillithiol system protein YtxJ